MRVALFDLDHTLIPFDSGYTWTQFLIARGHRPPDAADEYLGYARQYLAGTLDIFAMHRAFMAPLMAVPRDTLEAWRVDFAQAVAPQVPSAMQALVARHRAAGDVCAIVTATTRLVCEPVARLFDVPHLLCTESDAHGEIVGEPCYHQHKVSHVERWLQREGLPPLAQCEHSTFYSDSASDLPLLEAVTRPVAVRPDARLHAHALKLGWSVLPE